MDRVSAFTDLCTPEGLYRYGSQAGGVAPTPVTAEWLNLVQEELCNFVTFFLPALRADDNTQLRQAAQKLVKDFAITATTLAGYGILDAYTKNQTDYLLSGKANNAITLGGYGIGDAYTKDQVNQFLAMKAAVASTLEGYGIGDAYTKSQIDAYLAAKQDRNTASFGTSASWVRDGSTGAMEQFGVFGMNSGPNEQTITFPVAFPTACRSVVLTNMEDAAAENNIIRIRRWDKSSVTIINSGGNTYTDYTWIAKGN
ncbi:phage tail protein [Pseudomonas juntendi]|uniref:Phage tail protein n=1 Tax=Pseudomonas juntendi TaxID=2666183 RepID=A0A7W2KJ15_9PSED|nr:phage tail protein [Pseudomonas juntendi]MBA6099423.1 phage tail protein [Pseudomonas juntendi]